MEEVSEVEGSRAHLFFEAAGIFFRDGFGGLLDEADDVAHAEDAAGNALGIERFELVDLFADTGELDGLLGDLAEREGGAASSVAVELGEDDAGEAEGVVEMFGDADRLLTGGRVADEEDLLRSQRFLELLELFEEWLVDFWRPAVS